MTLDQFPLRNDITLKVHHKSIHGFTWFNKVSPECIAEMDHFIKVVRESSEIAQFWDVGAYHGIFAMTFKYLRPMGVAVAFEPSPILREVCEANCKGSGVFLCTKALSSETGPKNCRSEFQSHIVLGPGLIPGTNCTGTTDPEFVIDRVRGEELDFVPTLMKIDVEGHEGHVLQGLGSKLYFVQHLFIEFHGARIKDDGFTMPQIADILLEAGFNTVHDPLTNRTDPLDHILTYPIDGSEIQRVCISRQASRSSTPVSSEDAPSATNPGATSTVSTSPTVNA